MQKSEILEKRKSLHPDEVLKKSQIICDRFLKFAHQTWKHEHFNEKCIALYSPISGEVDPSFLKKDSLFQWAFFAYPRIQSLADGVMDFTIPSHETDFVKGRYGILEPRKELPGVGGREIVLVVVPGVLYGPQGERKGMGAGFYDRFLKKVPRAFRVALAYDFQLSEHSWEQNPWDVQMDAIFTETKEVLAKTSLTKLEGAN